ncbi:TPA: phage tail spike protein, partial [Streptococcus suis]
MIYLFDKDEKLIKIVRKSAVKTALQKYALTTERYVSDRLTVELKGLNADELEQVEYMAIQTMEDAHTFHYFYVAQKFSDELTTLIGVQSGIEELRKSPVFDKRPKNALARDVITDLLAGTNWQARFVGETTPHSTNFYYTSVFDALKKVCEVWDLEMQFFVEMNGNRIGARYIDFKQRIGDAVGKRVVYGHNALQILQEVERTNIFTALIGRGKGEESGAGYGRKITFEDVTWSTAQGKPVNKPAGQKYLELPLMTRQYGIKNADGSMRPKIGFVDFSEEENPEILIERTYKALIDAARPQLTLKTSSVYLKGVKIGDTIRVVRHDKKLDYDTRIFEITFNRLNNQSSDIKLGDRIGESNEAKAQTIADKAVEQFVTNEFSNFVQNLPDYLPSADGFNNNWYGAEDPTVQYPGKVLINDIWYKPDPEHEGHKIMLRWTGEVWEEILRTYDSEALRDRIAEEIAQVNQSMQTQAQEHDRQVADILSKTQSIESLANQAKSDAASALARANQVKTEAIADARAQVATVSQALNAAKTELQSAIASADQKARDSQASATALRNDLNLQASKILEQARAQTDLTSRVTSVETLADGTRSTVTELTKTVDSATQNLAGIQRQTSTIENNLSQTRTQYEALTQTVNTQTGQIESINRKTADLQSGIDGVTERFESLRIEDNLLLNSSFNQNLNQWHGTGVTIVDGKARITGEFNKTKYIHQSIKSQTANDDVSQVYIAAISVKVTNYVAGSRNPYLALYIDGRKNDSANTWFGSTYLTVNRLETVNNRGIVQFTTTFKVNVPRSQIGVFNLYIYARDFTGEVEFEKVSLRRGNIDLGWQPSPEDLRSEIATYKRTADEASEELRRQIQLADGKAVEAKTYAQQTAEGIKTRLESLETYKDGESTRANQYLTASRTETAKQLSAERAAIATNYVAKSIYDENVRGTTLKLNEIKTTADTAKQNLATYQETVDRKLTELTSSTQTLDGKINTASAKVDTVAGQIRTEISEVEGKIPTEVGGRNYFKKTTQISKFNQISTLTRNGKNGLDIGTTDTTNTVFRLHRVISSMGYWTVSFYAKSKSPTTVSLQVDICDRQRELFEVGKDVKKYVITSLVNNWSESVFHFVDFTLKSAGEIEIENLKIERGFIPTDWSPAPEDINDELSSVKTTITQTASGVEQLSTSLTTTDSKVTTAEAKIRQLISDVSSKVSQTDYNTLTGRVDSAETAITQNATEISKRLTSTQVESAITGKGYQTKSDVDSNITGRGYITSSALQPYALSTTVQNLVQETATNFSRTISRVENKIPTKIGVTNLLEGTSSDWKTIRVTRFNGLIKSYNPQEWALLNIKTGDSVTFSVDVKTTSGKKLRSRISFYGPNTHYYSETFVVNGEGRLSVTGVVPDGITSVQLSVDAKLTMTTNTGVTDESCRREKLEIGAIPTDWSPAPEDLATVTALHSVRDTVDSHTRTIGAVGTAGSILDNVSKVTQTAAGLVQEVSGDNGLKTQVSTLAG